MVGNGSPCLESQDPSTEPTAEDSLEIRIPALGPSLKDLHRLQRALLTMVADHKRVDNS